MTAPTAIKLSPAMVAALKGAVVVGDSVFVPSDTKTQTTKGLESRGLSEGTMLTPDGVEAARQLGNDTAKSTAEPQADLMTDDVQIDQQNTEIDALEAILRGPDVTGQEITPEEIAERAAPVLKAAVDLDKPHVVPNRADKRRAKFSLRAAASRLFTRQKNRKVAKYGDTKFGQA